MACSLRLLVIVGMCVAGCGDDAAGADGGSGDAGVDLDSALGDAGSEIGDAGTDGGGPDAAPRRCEAPCAEGFGCANGTCVRACGADVEALAATLNPALEVSFAICHDPSSIAAIPRDSLYQLDVVDGTMLSLGFRDEGSPIAIPQHVATPDLPDGATLFASGVLEMTTSSLSRAPALFGYTTDAPDSGGIYTTGSFATDALVEWSAPGNRSAAIDLATESFLVAGDGLGSVNDGPGVYLARFAGGPARRVLTNAGVPRSVILKGSTVIVSSVPSGDSWPDGTRGPLAFFVDIAELDGAPVDVFESASVERVAIASAELYDVLHFGIAAVTRDERSGEILFVDRYTPSAASSSEPAAFSAPERLVTGNGFDRFDGAGYLAMLFRHPHGTFVLRHRGE
jgi:hypothetical protein